MWKYAFRRIVTLVPVLVGTSFIAFMVLYLSPGDVLTLMIIGHTPPEVIEAFREYHGLNDPILIQYIRYITRAFTGNFGVSFTWRTPVSHAIIHHLPHTLQLGFTSILISLALALPIGILAAIKKSTWIDGFIKGIALIGISVPVFVLAILLMFLFPELSPRMPRPGASSQTIFIASQQYHSYLLLPSITLGIGMLSAMLYTIRNSLHEVIEKNYIRTARSKGLQKNTIVCKHALRSAIIPILSDFRSHLGNFVVAIIIVEHIFRRPGIGRLLMQGILSRDYPTTLGAIFMFVLIYAIINILLDITQAFIDPRIRERGLRV